MRVEPAQIWPDRLYLIRHGESAGNVARDAALKAGEAMIDIDVRDVDVPLSERLREKEFGIPDRLTSVGIREHYPDQAEFRRLLGKFYHRPPGGESWCDVILRLRSVSEMISREYSGERVVVIAHAVVVLCMRYILEHMTEAELLAVDKKAELANCSVTYYEYDETLGRHDSLRLKLYNFVAPLEEAGAPVTSQPDISVGAR